MKYLNTVFAATLLAGLLLASCAKDNKDVAQQVVSQEVLNKIADMGFSTENVQIIEEGYLVEGDIVLTKEDLGNLPAGVTLRIAETEQYRTTNLVSSPRTITVSVSGTVPGGFSIAVNNAIARYNAENLGLTFSRVTSGNADITISIVKTRQYIASAGFPDANGNPYNSISYSKAYTAYSDGFMTTVIAHEMGHCIGFRHTDYMNRAYSCGSGGNEGASTVGAVHIPGTPTGPDAASWMLACLSSTTNRPFNSNDKIALGTLYGY